MKLILVIIAFVSVPAFAEDIPQGLGHPPVGHEEFYDQSCCQTAGCEPVPNEAVTETIDGFNVLYLSPKYGIVRGHVPQSQAKNSNGCYEGKCYHVCPKWKFKSGGSCGIYGCYDMKAPPEIECIYVPSVT